MNRREWLKHMTLTAAWMGLPCSMRTALASVGEQPRAHRDLALQCAAWIESCSKTAEHGVYWETMPEMPGQTIPVLYDGMAGIVVFLAELYGTTHDKRWLRMAEQAADYTIHALPEWIERMGDGLYTGTAGVGFAVASVAQVGGRAEYDRSAKKIFSDLMSRAKRTGDGVEWDEINDIISGGAGIGLALLDAHRRWHDKAALDFARDAGRRLIAKGETAAEGGTKWFMGDGDFRKNYPNFSHGTAGIAYFLATLYERTGDKRFLDAAVSGATYLEAIATYDDDRMLIFHHDAPDGRALYYLGWCHGPAGTARLFYRLHKATGQQRWLDRMHALTRGVLASGIPETRTPGFWQNISACCGNVSVGHYFLDLERNLGDDTARAMIDRIVEDTRQRATIDQTGARWMQAENRIDPNVQFAQLGYMQGAAGVGTFLLRLDQASRGKSRKIVFPDTPFVA